MEVRKTAVFTKWFDNLKGRRARARIQMRIDRMEMGNFGDVSSVGNGVSEMRIFYGSGYRVYFLQTEKTVVVLLSAGDKGTQDDDILKAKNLAKQVEV